jgi:cyclopropane fatty-acyl-phospholipid synthase-like methyltransferase
MTQFDPAYTRDFYDRYGSREFERWDESPKMRLEGAILRHHLHQRVHPGDRVLDAGCGPGTYSAYLMDLGARVICLDISPVQLDYCRERAPASAESPGAGTHILAWAQVP